MHAALSSFSHLCFTAEPTGTSGTLTVQTSSPHATTVDRDGIPSSFSDSEKSDIIAIWRAVAEDFSPFNVDVTTEDPTLAGGKAALEYTDGTDQSWGIRVCIGGSSNDWFGGGAGGVAYLGSFDWNSDTPAFVFSKDLGPDYPKYIWEATSHEVGHTLNLEHDGTATEGYYGGAWP